MVVCGQRRRYQIYAVAASLVFTITLHSSWSFTLKSTITRPSNIHLVLLDRDGVINKDRGTWVLDAKDFHFIPGVPDSIAKLRNSDSSGKRRIAIVTNQSCIGRKLLTEDSLASMHMMMKRKIQQHGGDIDSIHVAPDTPENASDRRKPGPGMLVEAMSLHQVEPHNTAMVGDTINDILAAKRAGVPTRILVCTGHGEKRGLELEAKGIQLPLMVRGAGDKDTFGIPVEALPCWICRDLNAAVDLLCKY
mmetsp:Transcript_14549/g.28663  ORF Transcript_14549/g.28663 Transcript_14549/m.28663 type:complete len:249 (-) Transcript_14549:165-911(-)